MLMKPEVGEGLGLGLGLGLGYAEWWEDIYGEVDWGKWT